MASGRWVGEPARRRSGDSMSAWDFINITYPKAAKAHRCVECHTAIQIGEKHSYTSGKVEGDFLSYRLCMYCHRLAQAYCTEFGDDEGFPLGEVRTSLAEEGVADIDAWLVGVEAAEAAERQRLSDRRQRVEALGNAVICDRCGATLATYADKCSAALDDPCPGFAAIERAQSVTA